MKQSIDTPTTLGRTLREARKQRGLKQEDVALAAGVGIRFVGELERGKPTVRLAETLRVIAALGVSLVVEDSLAKP